MISPGYYLRRAAPQDAPEIDLMRRNYFQAVGRKYYEGSKDSTWVVCEYAPPGKMFQIVGVYAFQRIEECAHYWCTDLYRVPGRRGTRALSVMIEDLLMNAAMHNATLMWTRDPLNEVWARAVKKRYGCMSIQHLGIVEGITPCLPQS